MKKYLTLAILLLLTIGLKQSAAQILHYNSIGITSFAISNSAYSGLGHTATISSRLNLLTISDEVNISAGTHFSVGFAKNSSSNGTNLLLDIPALGEVNFGHAATNESALDYGGFFGAGFGNNMMFYNRADGSFDENSVEGLYINGGVKFYFKDSSFGVRFSYLQGSDSEDKIYGLGLMYNLGIF